MKPIGWYFDKIEQRDPVSKRALMAACNQSGISITQLLRVFEFTPKDYGLVRVRDEDGFCQLQNHHGVAGSTDSRVNAAIGGRSHNVRVDGSILISRTASDQHPIAILFDNDGAATTPRRLKPCALIVENLQNFLLLDETLIFVSKYYGSLDPLETEVIWSQGNAINNLLHRGLLQRFEHIWWLMDVDLGAARIMANALNYLSESTMTPIVPYDVECRLKDHGSPLSQRHRDEMLQLARKYTLLESFLKYSIKLHRQLEQETYLLKYTEE